MNRSFCIEKAIVVVLILIGFRIPLCAAGGGWKEMPRPRWEGTTDVPVPGVGTAAGAAVALPVAEAKPLAAATAESLSAGLYEFRLTLRPSHVANAIAFHTLLNARVGDRIAAEFKGYFFARAHQPEVRVFRALHTTAGPLVLRLEARSNEKVAETVRTAALLNQGGPAAGGVPSDFSARGREELIPPHALLALNPDEAVYFLVDRIEYRLLSGSGYVREVSTDKIRYRPGERLRGKAVLVDAGGRGGTGVLRVHLERGLRDRQGGHSVSVTLVPEPITVLFEMPLPEDELGYAVVAEYASADGMDRSEAAQYFTVAENFQRVALFGGNAGGTRDATLGEEAIRRAVAASRAEYYNAIEYSFWAPDDLLELTPEEEYWFSGQANYHMHGPTIQRQIRIAHEEGMAVVSYGKWLISGAPGWEAVYDRPADFDRAYRQPIGSWDTHHAWVFDLRRNGEQVPYSYRPRGRGVMWFDDWWNEFIGLSPNVTPAMVRTAAQEMAASVRMFGWDGIRWDDHIRVGGNAAGRSGRYEAWAARQTQALMRYFKDWTAMKCPGFRHGYNYLLIEKNKGYNWAKENFELDELCRDGGLLMNESIGNASGGWTFAEVAQNLQVDGDLCRERGAFLLGISYANNPRDRLIESALWASAGCRPYNSAMTSETRRYLTRFAQFALDERLCRIAQPEKVLVPETDTRLDWQRFVYETPEENGRRYLVINGLNIPWQDRRPALDSKDPPVWDLPTGTEPVTFRLTLPAGLRAVGASVVAPETLEVEPLAIQEGRFVFPSVALWRVVSAAPRVPRLTANMGAIPAFRHHAINSLVPN